MTILNLPDGGVGRVTIDEFVDALGYYPRADHFPEDDIGAVWVPTLQRWIQVEGIKPFGGLTFTGAAPRLV